jgi:hypothetical protein
MPDARVHLSVDSTIRQRATQNLDRCHHPLRRRGLAAGFVEAARRSDWLAHP